jgi:hypothetical protein
MSYAAALRPVSAGYDEPIEAPISPPHWQHAPAWGAAPTWGAPNIGDLLGGAVSQIGRRIVEDPYVQAELEQLKADCKTKAKSGVSEWMDENKVWLIAGGLGLLLGNFIMLTVGVLPAVERSVNKARRGDSNRHQPHCDW